VYYADYVHGSTSRFASLLNAVSKENALVVIENSNLGTYSVPHSNFHIIRGDNALWEFSGWERGLQYSRESGLFPDDGIVILANDTFCHHNKFGPITRSAFIRSFRKLLEDPAKVSIAGEIHGGSLRGSIIDKPFSSWISTYLFAMTTSLLEAMESIIPDSDMDVFFTGKADSNEFLRGPISASLARHVQGWLFGRNENNRWYKSEPLNEANMHRFVGKAKSILCECYLSAHAASVGANFISVFGSPMLRQIRRIERLLASKRV